MSLGLGAGLFGIALDLVGYIPNAVQSAATLSGIKSIMVVLPTIGLLIGCAIILFYPLRNGVHESIVEQLEARRRAAPVQLTSDATG